MQFRCLECSGRTTGKEEGTQSLLVCRQLARNPWNVKPNARSEVQFMLELPMVHSLRAHDQKPQDNRWFPENGSFRRFCEDVPSFLHFHTRNHLQLSFYLMSFAESYSQ